jgi:predicted  nucleic acid-binding Zn-ribbon protein
MTEAGKVTAIAATQVGNWDLHNIQDLAPTLAKAGITAKDFALAVTGTRADLDRFNEAVKATSLSAEEQKIIITGAASEFDNHAKALDNAATFSKVFGDQAAITARQVDDLKGMTQQMRNQLVGADKAADGLADSLGKAGKKTADLTGAYERLSDQISSDQAMIDLADQIDAVTEAGDAAIQAQKDANDAIRQGAEDATAKQRDAEQAMRDYQTAVNQTKQDIINLATTANVSPVELKATLDKVDQGDLAGAKADAESWSKRNPIELTVKLSDIGAALKKAGANATGTVTTTNITQFLAAPDARRQAAQLQRTARVNGRR